LLACHSEIVDQDLELGLFDNYHSPEWITHKQAADIEMEIEDYILKQWSKNGPEFKNLELQTDQLLKMLKCLAEDLIYD
jgi:hypothetical protein